MGEYKAEAAIIGLTVCECVALYLGYDGAILGAVVIALAGLGGYELGKRKKENDHQTA